MRRRRRKKEEEETIEDGWRERSRIDRIELVPPTFPPISTEINAISRRRVLVHSLCTDHCTEVLAMIGFQTILRNSMKAISTCTERVLVGTTYIACLGTNAFEMYYRSCFPSIIRFLDRESIGRRIARQNYIALHSTFTVRSKIIFTQAVYN